MASSSSSPFQSASKKNTINCPAPNSIRNHSPSAILDLLIFILVIFSASFLIYSYVSYLFKVISLLLPSFSLTAIFTKLHPEVFFYTSTFMSLAFFVLLFRICRNPRWRSCGKEGCSGFWNCMEYDLQYQDEETLIMGNRIEGFKEIDELPVKGGTQTNQEYESIREQLRQIAPQNGRAVLIFRHRCGCPYAKLEGWGPKDVRRPKNPPEFVRRIHISHHHRSHYPTHSQEYWESSLTPDAVL